MLRTLPTTLIDRCRAIVGRDHVLVDADLRAGYEIDWTGRFRGEAVAIVRPADTGEVREVLLACFDAGAAVVPQGGNTGLVGGSVPRGRGDEVVISTRRLQRLDPIDRMAGQVTVGAGVTLAALHQHAAAAGWVFGVDLAARESATIGGMVATNAGGLHFIRYGGMRAHVVGLEVVLPSGAVLSRLDGLQKDNTGYDLSGLMVGSEGTLGIVTAARLRCAHRSPFRMNAMLAVRSWTDAVEIVARLRTSPTGATLEAIEGWTREGMRLVASVGGRGSPIRSDAPVIVLVEWASDVDIGTEVAQTIATLDELLVESVVATDGGRRADLWRWRDELTSAIQTLAPTRGSPHKFDVAVPVARVAAFIGDATARLGEAVPRGEVFVFGHLADGNVHINIVGLPSDDRRAEEIVSELVIVHRGSVSAEHGIGVAKRTALEQTRSVEDLGAMRAIKRAFDPTGQMNPGVLVD